MAKRRAGRPRSGDIRLPIAVRLRPATIAALARESVRQNRTQSKVVADILEQVLVTRTRSNVSLPLFRDRRRSKAVKFNS